MVAIKQVWTELDSFLLHVTSAVENLHHIGSTPNGDAASSVCVERLKLALRISAVHL